MKSSRIRKYAHLLKAFPTLPRKMRQSVVATMDDDLIKCICEICLNVIKCNVPMKSNHKQRLSHFKQIIRSLAETSTPLRIKKRVIQRGGSFLPLLFSIITPLLSKLIA